MSGVYPDPLPAKAKAQLVSLGVQVLLNTKVTGIDVQGVQLGDVGFETSTVIWAAGVQASSVDNTAGWEADRAGGVIVQTDLSVPGQSSVFVIGDQAAVTDDNGVRVPGLAPAALRMGK
ncbi:MAG: NADH dehydrogenase, partial [Myxococcota bacterium]